MTEEQLQLELLNPQTRRAAFERAIRMYSQKLYWLIRRTVRFHDDADDVLQDTFVKAWKNLDSFRGDSKFYTWIYRIALFEAINHNKKRQRTQETFQEVTEDTEYLIDNVADEPFFDGDKGERLLQQAIETLPDKQRLVFEMRYFDDLPYKDIATVTETSEGALKASFHHAVRKIKEFISNKD